MLSVLPTWALAFMNDLKDCENRNYPWPGYYNKQLAWVAVVASSRNSLEAEKKASTMAGRKVPTESKEYTCKNKCLGFALVGPTTHHSTNSKWAMNSFKYHWSVHRIFRLAQSIPGFDSSPGQMKPFTSQPEAVKKLEILQKCVNGTATGYFVL